ncbi:MAG: MBL fold metallo-hydrolase [Planctomycetes bacterium]|nr:MBL fold metallo-hydrolase [Planctomycetota bacterium]
MSYSRSAKFFIGKLETMSRHPAVMGLTRRIDRSPSAGRWRVIDCVPRVAPAPQKPDLSRWEHHALAAAWLGHATVLLRVAGLTVLTDPVFSNRVGLGLGVVTAGPRRLLAPALRINELPSIDVVLISHAHFDHMDRPSLRRLGRRFPGARVITSEHNSDLIHGMGFASVTELRWGETSAVESLNFTAIPVKHWGARTIQDRHRGYAGFVLEGCDAPRHRVLYAGDTAFHEGFRDQAAVDLAVMGIGAYNPWIESHANPEQVVAMADHARAKRLLPMHHSTFVLSDEPLHEPMERLRAEFSRRHGQAGLDRILIERVGGVWVA